METNLRDRVAMVTGASGGIGAEIARALAAESARVVAHFGHRADRAQALVRDLGPGCVALGADLTAEAEVRRLFTAAESALGPVQILIANAGSWPADDTPVEHMTLERWNATVATNLTSVFLCMREFLCGVRRHQVVEPAAVIIGSTAGSFGEAGHADYAAAKAALTYGLARSLKNEICQLAPRGRVNVICPGWTLTPVARGLRADPARIRRVLQTVPLRKVGRPQDVAAAVVYLASSRLSGHVTGQVLTVAGGMEGRVLYREDEVDPTRA